MLIYFCVRTSNHFKFISQENTRLHQCLFKAPGIVITQSKTWSWYATALPHHSWPGRQGVTLASNSASPSVAQDTDMFDLKSSRLSTQLLQSLEEGFAKAQHFRSFSKEVSNPSLSYVLLSIHPAARKGCSRADTYLPPVLLVSITQQAQPKNQP